MKRVIQGTASYRAGNQRSTEIPQYRKGSKYFLCYGRASESLMPVLVKFINNIFGNGTIPDIMKQGVLTPMFKRKGSSTEVKNYRGMTVTPAISKLLECVIKKIIQPFI